MQPNNKPVITVLPYELRYTDDLSRVKISELANPLDQALPPGVNSVADLREADHLIVYCCWKSLSRNYDRLRCKVDLLVSEPPAVQARYYFLIPYFAKKFHSILTFSDQLLQKIPNGVFHPGASRWVNASVSTDKNKLISIIASRKAKTEGQRLRHEVIKNCVRQDVLLDLFGRGYREVERKEVALASYMFSVCIENSCERNYFTEKIVDCLAQKVVPIYWGAPNIGEFFDIEGIIVCQSEEDIVTAVKNLTPSEYAKRGAAIEKNYDSALRFQSTNYMAAEKIYDLNR